MCIAYLVEDPEVKDLSPEAVVDIVIALGRLDVRSRRAALMRLRGALLADIAPELGVSRARAGQVIESAFTNMARYLTRKPHAGLVAAILAHAPANVNAPARFEARAPVPRAPTFCDYAFCPRPRQPIREGRKHHQCRLESARRSR